MQYIEFNSHEQQDEFIFNLFAGKRTGTFLDISCSHPRIGSNTFTLEKYQEWSGYCFDVADVEAIHNWSKVRSTPFVMVDATSIELTNFLKENITDVVDYISLDVDFSNVNLAFATLSRVIDAGVRFKAMTFEHEHYIHGDAIRTPSRQLLEKHGYVRLFEDVKPWFTGYNDNYAFEDWWIDPQYFSEEILAAKGSGLFYFECVDRLRKVTKVPYRAQHNCSSAWADQYCLFWTDQEKAAFTDRFRRYPGQTTVSN